MAWKGSEADSVIAMTAADIKWAQWLRVARNFQLRVGLANHKRETFDGFEREVCFPCLRVLIFLINYRFQGSRQAS